MSNILWKNFHLCFTKFKCFPTILSPPLTSDFDEDHENLLQISTTNENLVKNFNSIYDITSGSTSKSLTCSTEDFFSSSDDSDDIDSSIPDFSSALASRRFFFSSPGKSNSIAEELRRPETEEMRPVVESGMSIMKSPRLVRPMSPCHLYKNAKLCLYTRGTDPPIGCNGDSVTEIGPAGDGVLSGGVAVHTFSPDPYADFRISMQEMVEAHELKDVGASWDFLHELLLCYLNLNPKHTHKLIIGAFTDLIVSLMPTSTTTDRRRRCSAPPPSVLM